MSFQNSQPAEPAAARHTTTPRAFDATSSSSVNMTAISAMTTAKPRTAQYRWRHMPQAATSISTTHTSPEPRGPEPGTLPPSANRTTFKSASSNATPIAVLSAAGYSPGASGV